MEKPDKSEIRTPEEVLEGEIKDLERPIVKSWIVWVGSIVLAAILGAVGALLLIVPGRAYPQGVTPIEISEPRGEQETAPTVYRWTAFPGAATYIVAVTEIGDGEVHILRPVRDTIFAPSDVEIAYIAPGEYRWTVAAMDRNGKVLARGQAEFRVPELQAGD